MIFFNFFKKVKKERLMGSFSSFFLYASPDEKKKVFMDAARRANQDQRETFRKAGLKLKAR